jgi:hypothetical protein
MFALPAQARAAVAISPRLVFGLPQGVTIMSEFGKFQTDINATKVSADLLGEVMVMYASLPSEEWEDFDLKITRVIELLNKKNYGKKSDYLAMAVAIRLMALDSVLLNDEFKGFRYPRDASGISYIHGDLLKAAAEEPILEGPQGQPIFEVEAFRQTVLRIAVSRGQA